MRYRISISTKEIIDISIRRSASDFRALRSKKPQEADMVYDDFVLLPDNREELLDNIYKTASVLRTVLSAHIRDRVISPELIRFDIVTVNNADCDALQILFTDCFVCDILSWWYMSRDEDLSRLYAIRASDDVSEILSALTPKFCERRLRYF